MQVAIRPYHTGDTAALGHVFYRAVHEGARHAYTAAQCRAWAPAPQNGPDWAARLGDAITLVADTDAGPVGFFTLTRNGLLDLTFVLPEAMGTGVARALYNAIEDAARAEGFVRLTSDASHLARGFLMKQGWHEIARQQVRMRSEILVNFRMAKPLADRAQDSQRS